MQREPEFNAVAVISSAPHIREIKPAKGKNRKRASRSSGVRTECLALWKLGISSVMRTHGPDSRHMR